MGTLQFLKVLIGFVNLEDFFCLKFSSHILRYIVNVLNFLTFTLSILKINVGYQGWNSHFFCQNSKQGIP